MKLLQVVLKKIIKNEIENNKTFVKSNKLILKSQQRFKSERKNVFTEEVNRIACFKLK